MVNHDSDVLMWGTNAIVWQWDLASDIIYFKVSENNIFGYDCDKYKLEFTTFLELIHPDDRSFVAKHVRLSTISEQSFFASEYRILHKGGSWIWVKEKCRFIDSSQKNQIIEGSLQIIDAEKEDAD